MSYSYMEPLGPPTALNFGISVMSKKDLQNWNLQPLQYNPAMADQQIPIGNKIHQTGTENDHKLIFPLYFPAAVFFHITGLATSEFAKSVQ